jgi:hypothetical protein
MFLMFIAAILPSAKQVNSQCEVVAYQQAASPTCHFVSATFGKGLTGRIYGN